MQIQTLGSPAASKTDERPLPATDALTGRPAPRDPKAATAATPPTREQLDAAVKQINLSLPASSSLEFSVDDDSKQTIVKIVDLNTKEVLRQIPSTEALEIAKAVDKMMGRLISQKV